MRRPTTVPFWSAGYPPGFTGNEAWYDASDVNSMRNNAGAVPSNGEGIKLWADKSGNSSVNVLCLNANTSNFASFTALTAFGTGNFTLVAKFSTSAIGATQAMLAGANNSPVFYVDATGKLSKAKSAVGNILAGNTTLSAFTTYTAYYVRSGTTGTFYLNAVADSAGAADAVDYTVGLSKIGQSDTTPANAFGGLIYAVRAYSAALTPAEITADYNGTVQANCVLNQDFSGNAKLAPSVTAAVGGTVTINTSGATGARISGARDLYQGTAANQPIYLPHSGTNYGYLNGVSGNYFSSPDAAPLDIVGDIDVRAYATATNWSTATQSLADKLGAAGQRSYVLRMNSGGNGYLELVTSADGAAVVSATSGVIVPFANNAGGWVRATLDVDDGSGNRVYKFWTSTDGPGVTSPTWTQLGSTTTTAGTTSIFNGTRILTIGSDSAGTASLFSGTVSRVQIRSNILDNGTGIAFDFNPAAYTSGTTFLDSSSNAATITLNGGATIVTRTCLYWDGSNDCLKAAAFALAQPTSIYFVGSQISWNSTDILFDGNVASTYLEQRNSTPNVRLRGNVSALGDITTWALNTPAVITGIANGASSSERINRSAATTGTVDTTAMNGFTLGASQSGGANANITAQEVLLYSTADSTPIQDAKILYLGRHNGIAV